MVAERSSSSEQPTLPDFFADSVGITAAPFGFTLTFLLSDPDALDNPPRAVGRARISPELATAFLKLLSEAVDTHRTEMDKRAGELNVSRRKAKSA